MSGNNTNVQIMIVDGVECGSGESPPYQRISDDVVEYFCNKQLSSKWHVAKRLPGVEGTMKNDKFIKSIMDVVKATIEEHDVLLIGFSYGGMICSKIADIFEATGKAAELGPRLRIVTFGSIYLSRSQLCTHYVIRGDIANIASGIDRLKKKPSNVRYIDWSDATRRRVGRWGLHELYFDLILEVIVKKILPNEKMYEFCVPARGAVFGQRKNLRFTVTCYDSRNKKTDVWLKADVPPTTKTDKGAQTQ
jgi:hypothetical protein